MEPEFWVRLQSGGARGFRSLLNTVTPSNLVSYRLNNTVC